MTMPTVITFIAYFVLLLGIGFYFYRRNESIEEYLLGGRGMGAWVTALSAQASDMSGWLLMGLPGAIYLAGVADAWIAIGLFAGTALNWKLVSGRLRLYTQKTGTITLPCFFEARFGDPTGVLRIVSAIVILIFFTIYASSGLVAAGKLFESTFNVSYQAAVLIGGAIIVVYTFLGGFLAVCWTDLFGNPLGNRLGIGLLRPAPHPRAIHERQIAGETARIDRHCHRLGVHFPDGRGRDRAGRNRHVQDAAQ